MVALALPASAAVVESDEPGDLARWGWALVVAFFGVFLGWATFVRLDASAQATGSISVAGNRQVVQHHDGGIVRALHVREGQHVHAGDVLIELQGGEEAAAERSLAAQAIRLEAERARLAAERAGGDLIAPSDFAGLTGQDRADADAAMLLQHAQLATARAALADQKRVLGEQASQLSQEIGGYRARIALNHGQDKLYDDQLGGMRSLAAQGYVSKNKVRDLEHAQADLAGQTAQLDASAASAREEIAERRLQALTLDSQLADKVAGQLHDTDVQLGELLPKWREARRQLERTRIRATASGQVVGLTVFTVGGVVPAGQTLMSIVPDAAPLEVEAQLSPDDADDVRPGQRAEVRVSALHDRGAPRLEGTVTRVSADSFKDDKTGRTYYTATVSVPPAGIAALTHAAGGGAALKAGLPVQVTVPLRRRTLLQYLLEPIDQAVWRGMREH